MKLTNFQLTFLIVITSLNIAFAQSKKPPYEIIAHGVGFTSFNTVGSVDGKDYISIPVFLNNNTDTTLNFPGTNCRIGFADCYNALFVLKQNPYFHLSADVCNVEGYSKISLPPHRSHEMVILLTTDNQPDRDVPLIIKMNLYKWVDDSKKHDTPGNLYDRPSDSLVLHYNANHQTYWLGKDEIRDKKGKSILPDKDYYLLTDDDRKLFSLTIENPITESRDPFVTWIKNQKPKEDNCLYLPAKLRNNTGDTLRFCSMSCSWNEFWGTDNPNIWLADWPCTANFPDIITVAPYQEYKQNLPIIYHSNMQSGSKYRIYMCLQKIPKDADWRILHRLTENKHINKLWSNELTIP